MSGGREGAGPLRRAARERPGAPALDAGGETWSYRALDRRADALAGRLRELGVGEGGRVAVLLPRGPLAVAAVHALPRLGAVLAPLHRGWTDAELAPYLRRLEADALLCAEPTADRAAALAEGGPRLVREGELAGPGEVSDGGRARDRGGVDPDRDQVLVATSGTTGRPRAVRLTPGNLLAVARGSAERMGLGPGDRWLASLSLAHVGGVAMAVRAAATGATLVLRGGFDAGAFLEMADRGEVTHASLVPVMLRRALEARPGPAPEGLSGVLLGGDAADPSLVEEALERGWPVHPTYGLTEAASQVATATPAEAADAPHAVGRPLPGVRVRIGDDGEDHAAEEGEILVAGPTVSPGYLDGETLAPDGWLRTGDAGRLDGEGRLTVTGRLSARIVSGGVTVDPREVEAALRAHPGVREAAVVGVSDPEWGERVGAVVVAAGKDPPPEEELLDFCRGRLAGPKLPRRFAFVGELPRTATGKPDPGALRELLGA